MKFSKFPLHLCPIAWFVLVFSIIVIMLDIYLFGTKVYGFILHVAVFGLLVWLANWGCYKQGFNWVAWIVVIFVSITLAGSVYIVKNQYTDLDVNQALEEERHIRDHLGM